MGRTGSEDVGVDEEIKCLYVEQRGKKREIEMLRIGKSDHI
jgi:hypothetical protein